MESYVYTEEKATEVKAPGTVKQSKYVHRVAKIDLKGTNSAVSVNSVRGSIVKKVRPGAMSTDKARLRPLARLNQKSPEPMTTSEFCSLTSSAKRPKPHVIKDETPQSSKFFFSLPKHSIG